MAPYALYGAPVSLHTGKARSYSWRQGSNFVEAARDHLERGPGQATCTISDPFELFGGEKRVERDGHPQVWGPMQDLGA